MVQTCSEYLKHLIHLLQSVEQDDSNVSRKKSKEIRCKCPFLTTFRDNFYTIFHSVLLCRWELLLKKIKSNIHQTGIYNKLKEDIILFEVNLEELNKSLEDIILSDLSTELQDKLQLFKVTTFSCAAV